MASSSSETFAGLKWSEKDANKMAQDNVGAEAFRVVKKWKTDKNGNRVLRKDENGNEMQGQYVRASGSSGERKLTGIAKYLTSHPNDIYIPAVNGKNYWITGSREDVKAALEQAQPKLSDREVNAALKGAITADNVKGYRHNGQSLDEIVSERKSNRTTVDLDDLTKITPMQLALMASLVKSKSHIMTNGAEDPLLPRISRTGRPMRSSGVKSPGGRAPLTPETLWEKANKCAGNRIVLPVKRGNEYHLDGEAVSQAVNVSSMTSDGKGAKFCYAPRKTGANQGRRRARKLVHIKASTQHGQSNILVSTDKPDGLKNYLAFMGNFFSDKDRANIRAAYNKEAGVLQSNKSPARSGKRRSPGRKASPKKSNKRVVKGTIPRDYSSSDAELSEAEEVMSSGGSGSESEPEPVKQKSPARVVSGPKTPSSSATSSGRIIPSAAKPASTNPPARVRGQRGNVPIQP